MARKTKEKALQGRSTDKLLDADADSLMTEQGDTEEGYAEYVGSGEAERDYRKIIAKLEAEKDALRLELERQAAEYFAGKPNGEPARKPSLKKTRDRKSETYLAKTRQAAALAAIRTQRDANGGDEEIFQVAQALILCGLPYEKTDQTKITRSARLADGSVVDVTFSTGLKAGMPYGSDRSLLHFLFDKAVKNNSRFISWETATEFLQAMNMAQGGKNRRDLRQRFLRIRSLTIGVERTTRYGSSADLMPVIRHSHLPTSVDVKAEKRGQSLLPIGSDVVFGVEIDPTFFEDLKRHHVPTPAAIIRTTRNKSQQQDIMLWLHWRCYAAKRSSLIKWEYLRMQLWQGDKKSRRIKERFADAIAALKIIWPELQAESLKHGLMVGPPLRGRYLLAQGAEARQLNQ
jgi:Plasmid encoded RepA protein